MSETFEAVKEVVVNVMKIDGSEISADTKIIEDLKADSMDQFFLIDGICEKFDLDITDEDARDIKTIGDIVKYVDSH
jgi:acyl carrier protein